MIEGFRINNLPPYLLDQIAKSTSAARLKGIEVIDLSKINPDFGAPTQAVDKLVRAALQTSNHRYSSSQGIPKLRQSIANWYKENYNVDVNFETEVVTTLGTKEGLAHLIMATIFPGDLILLPTPAYPMHGSAVVISGGNYVGVSLLDDEPDTSNHNDNDKLSAPVSKDIPHIQRDTKAICLTESSHFFDRLEKAYTSSWPKPKFIIISFPHNPSGIVVDKSFYQRLYEFVKEKNIYVISDFAYADICFDGYKAPSILEIPGFKDYAVEFYSFSKGYAMPGWRAGFCVGNANLIEALKKIKSHLDFGLFQPIQIAVVDVLQFAKSRASEISEIYQNRRDVFIEELESSANWATQKPLGGVFSWLRFPEKLTAKLKQINPVLPACLTFSEQLFSRYSVSICPGVAFDPNSENYVRVAFVESEQKLRQAAHSIGQLMKELEVL